MIYRKDAHTSPPPVMLPPHHPAVNVVSPSPSEDEAHIEFINDPSSTLIGYRYRSAGVHIATLNVNHLTADKLHALLTHMLTLHIDVLCLQDTRTTRLETRHLKRLAKASLGPSTFVGASPLPDTGCPSRHRCRRKSPPPPGQSAYPSGGQMTIIHPRWAPHVKNYSTDPTGLGLLTSITLATSALPLHILSTYWPFPHLRTAESHPHSLLSRLQSVIHTNHLSPSDPLKWLGHYIDNHTHHLLRAHPGHALLLGDFNTQWTRSTNSYGPLSTWAELHNWQNEPLTLRQDIGPPGLTSLPPTRYSDETPTGTIDHILTHIDNPYPLTSYLQTTDPAITTLSDHRLLSTSLPLHPPDPNQTSQTITPRPSRIPFNHRDQHAVDRYQATLTRLHAETPWHTLTPEQAVTRLEELSVEACRLTQPTKKHSTGPRSPYTDGYSATFHAIKIHRDSLLLIKRLLTHLSRLPHSRRATYYQTHIIRITQRWRDQLAPLDLDAETRHHTTERFHEGPTYYRTVHPSSLSLAKLHRHISILRNDIHGKQRTRLRQNISDHIARREDLRTQGKLRQVIQSILQRQEPYYDMTTLRTGPDSLTTDPHTIHTALTSAFTAHFATPTHITDLPTQDPQFDWPRFFSDLTYFHTVLDSHPHTQPIPEPVRHHLWQGMRPPPTSQDVTAALDAAFATPPTYEAFRRAIIQARADTAPGRTLLSYPMIKAWPDPITRHAYDLLATTWSSKTTPDTWSKRWLIFKPKTPEPYPSPASLRPLTLIESLRKIWEKLILGTIHTSWRTTNPLAPNQHCGRRRGTTLPILELTNLLEHHRDTRRTLYLASWDISKAFDSVSKGLLQHSWTRLGLPPPYQQLDRQPRRPW